MQFLSCKNIYFSFVNQFKYSALTKFNFATKKKKKVRKFNEFQEHKIK